MKKFILRALPVLMVLALVWATPVFALDIDSTFNHASETNNLTTANTAISRVWGTILTVLQIAAVAAIVFSGVKYMFAGADEKATIKQGLLILAIGAILVFGASTVVKLLIGAVNDV